MLHDDCLRAEESANCEAGPLLESANCEAGLRGRAWLLFSRLFCYCYTSYFFLLIENDGKSQ